MKANRALRAGMPADERSCAQNNAAKTGALDVLGKAAHALVKGLCPACLDAASQLKLGATALSAINQANRSSTRVRREVAVTPG